jgi:hypothetical protein
MTGARKLVAASVTGIEQHRDDPARRGLVHLGADHEMTRVAVSQPTALGLAAGLLLLAPTEVDDVSSATPHKVLSARSPGIPIFVLSRGLQRVYKVELGSTAF